MPSRNGNSSGTRRPTSSQATIEQYGLLSQIQRLEDRFKRQAAQNRELERQNFELRERLSVLERIDSIVPRPPDWTRVPKAKGALHRGIPTLILSDCHWDEVVNPHEVEGANCYNRNIAVIRLQQILAGVHDVTRKFFAGLTYEGATLLLGGDLLSGNIHEELVQTNEDTVFGSVDFWSDLLCAFIQQMAEEFGKLHVATVVGNHGRNTRKPRAKLRVRDNLDWLLYRIAARGLSGDSRITWQIPESADVTFKLYNTTYRGTHGDQFRGGSGISAMMSPLFLGQHRKSRRQMELHNPFDWLVMGHWHDYFVGKGLIVNGSVKGYDEYAYVGNYQAQRPIQALWITTPENGLTFPAPIFADNRKLEKW